jgi:hypothetical protein
VHKFSNEGTNFQINTPKKILSSTVGFFFLSQPEWKVLNSKIETKHYKGFLWIMTIKKPLKTDDFVNFSQKSSSEQ